MTVESVQQTVDKYLSLKKQLEQTKAELDSVAERIKEFGPCKLAGKIGQVEVCSVRGRKTTEWAKVVAAAGVPQETVDKYTKQGADTLRIDTIFF